MDAEVAKCRGITQELVRIVNLARGLAHGWDHLPRDFRAEHLDHIREHARDLLNNGDIVEKEHDEFTALVDTFQRHNEGEAGIHNKNMLYEQALDLAISAIHNCVENKVFTKK